MWHVSMRPSPVPRPPCAAACRGSPAASRGLLPAPCASWRRRQRSLSLSKRPPSRRQARDRDRRRACRSDRCRHSDRCRRGNRACGGCRRRDRLQHPASFHPHGVAGQDRVHAARPEARAEALRPVHAGSVGGRGDRRRRRAAVRGGDGGAVRALAAQPAGHAGLPHGLSGRVPAPGGAPGGDAAVAGLAALLQRVPDGADHPVRVAGAHREASRRRSGRAATASARSA